jgi:hypothetical protein
MVRGLHGDLAKARCTKKFIDRNGNTHWGEGPHSPGRPRQVTSDLFAGGSKKTVAFAPKHKKPWLHICREFTSAVRGNMTHAKSLLRFVSDHKIKILNVAGSRANKEPEIAAFVKEAFFTRPDSWIGGPCEG